MGPARFPCAKVLRFVFFVCLDKRGDEGKERWEWEWFLDEKHEGAHSANT